MKRASKFVVAGISGVMAASLLTPLAQSASASESAIGPDGNIYVIQSGDTSSVLKKYNPSNGSEDPIPVNPTKPVGATAWFNGPANDQNWQEGLAGRMTAGKNYTDQVVGSTRVFTNDTRAQNDDPAVKDIFVADNGTIYIFEDLYEGLTVGYYPRDTVYRHGNDESLLTLYTCNIAKASAANTCRGSSDPRYLADPKNAGVITSAGAYDTTSAKNFYRSYPQYWSEEYIGTEFFPPWRDHDTDNHWSVSASSDEYELPCSGFDANYNFAYPGNPDSKKYTIDANGIYHQNVNVDWTQTEIEALFGSAQTCTGLLASGVTGGGFTFTGTAPNATLWNTPTGLNYAQYYRPYKLKEVFSNSTDENACGMYIKQKDESQAGKNNSRGMYFGDFNDTNNLSELAARNATIEYPRYSFVSHIYNKNFDYDSDVGLKYIFGIQSSTGADDVRATQIGAGGLNETEIKALPRNDSTDFDNTIRIPFGLIQTNTIFGGSREYTTPDVTKDANLTYAIHGNTFVGGNSEADWYRLIVGYDRFDRNIYPRNDYYMARGRVLIGTPSSGSYTWAAEHIDLSSFGPSPTPYVTDAAFDESGNLYVLATFYSDYYGTSNSARWTAMKKLLDNTTGERTYFGKNDTLMTTYDNGVAVPANASYPSPTGFSSYTPTSAYKGIHDIICTNANGNDKGLGKRVVMKLTKQANGYAALGSELVDSDSTKSLDDIIWETAIIDDMSIASHEETNDWVGTSIAISTDSSDGTSDRMFVATQSGVLAYDLDGTVVSGATFNLKSVLNMNKTALHTSCSENNLGDYDPYRIRSIEADDHVVSVHFSRNGQSGASSVMLLSKEDLSLLKYDNGTPEDDTDDKIQVYGECGDGAANYTRAAAYPSDTGNNDTNLGAVNLAVKTRVDLADETSSTYGDLELLYFGADDPSGAFTKRTLIEGLVEFEPESNLDGSSFIILPYDGNPSRTVGALVTELESKANVGVDAVNGMWSFAAGTWTSHDVEDGLGALTANTIVVIRMSGPDKAKAALADLDTTIKVYYDQSSIQTTGLKGGWNIVYCATGNASPTMGITVPEADGRGVLGVFTWGDDQNPNTWTHIALPLSADTDLPEGYLDLTSIGAGDIVAVYLDINDTVPGTKTYPATC